MVLEKTGAVKCLHAKLFKSSHKHFEIKLEKNSMQIILAMVQLKKEKVQKMKRD